ncbi:hypothetical protein [Massilia sp. BKSP1R2A-1]|uniref:hypothetical protein n=1 Tax=Massilia sp. BKSP1R2A-1 TaxID=3422595 RepID=UPI003D341E33
MPAASFTPPAVSSSRTVLLWAGFIVAILLPVCAGLLLGLSSLMPGCHSGGSSGSAMSGCELGGFNLNWLLELLTPAILLSLLTIPVGLLLCLVGLFMPRKKVAVPAVDNEVGTQVLAALRDLREGRAARTRCPRCRAVILLTAGRAPDGAPRVNSACACGACDDSIALAGVAA